MYEDITYEILLRGMIKTVQEYDSNIDVREGSIIYNALAPAAAELQNMYIQLDAVLDNAFADTASRDYLIKRCAERGITVEPATRAILKGEFNMDIPIDSRFTLGTLNYVAISRISPGVYQMQCETYGYEGNEQLGTLLPVEYIHGLTSAELTELLIPGKDEENTEHLRKRYFESLAAQAYGGNQKDYIEKVTSLEGVGGVKVLPVWNGGGTVKLIIIDATYAKPSALLVEQVQTAVDPLQNAGQGVGIAPIGHVVTVEGVKETVINLSADITYQPGYTWADVKESVENAIDEYFEELSGEWADDESLTVRISQMEIRILDLPGILDIADLLINGAAQNLVLDNDCIPKRGTFNG